MPSAVLDELDPDAGRPGRPGRSRSTARDWFVDFFCFLLAAALGLAAADSLRNETHLPHALAVVDQVLG
ncbi:sensor histidine kinase, partial [Streptomyces spiralis]